MIAFSEEEGVRFGVPFIGSRGLIGALDYTPLQCRDASGITVAQAIHGFGLAPQPYDLDPRSRFLEIHIEQGPVLASGDLPLGIVETINGQTRMDLRFLGGANHAGTTPMHLRRDALAFGPVPPTLSPVTCFARSTSAIMRTLSATPPRAAKAIARRRGLDVDSETHLRQPAVPMDSAFTEELYSAAMRSASLPCGWSPAPIPTRYLLSRLGPAGMIFIPCRKGVSHRPDEYAAPEDIARGALVLAHALARLTQ